jgi:hypothetical protein
MTPLVCLIIVLKRLVFECFFAYNQQHRKMKLDGILYALCISVIMLPMTSFGFCFDDAGKQYGINPELLENVARSESGLNPKAINRNSNGSYDLGLMQINSAWLKQMDINADNLLQDACLNAKTGARILRQCIDRYGYTWEAVGCYNATSRPKRVNYAWKVFRQFNGRPGRPNHVLQKEASLNDKDQGSSSLLFRARDITDIERSLP